MVSPFYYKQTSINEKKCIGKNTSMSIGMAFLTLLNFIFLEESTFIEVNSFLRKPQPNSDMFSVAARPSSRDLNFCNGTFCQSQLKLSA